MSLALRNADITFEYLPGRYSLDKMAAEGSSFRAWIVCHRFTSKERWLVVFRAISSKDAADGKFYVSLAVADKTRFEDYADNAEVRSIYAMIHNAESFTVLCDPATTNGELVVVNGALAPLE